MHASNQSAVEEWQKALEAEQKAKREERQDHELMLHVLQELQGLRKDLRIQQGEALKTQDPSCICSGSLLKDLVPYR